MALFKNILVLIGVIALASCGSDDDDDEAATTTACEYTLTSGSSSFKSCAEYSNLSATQITTLEAACTANASDNLTPTTATTCDKTNSVGTCAVAASGETPAYTIYFKDGYTAASGETACDSSSGTWTAAS